ncbi:hypothetical protein [Nitratireductor sp. GCM10026969]|uniref:hypothetical protein n=1 Tax=Nitratireductor sp. GCM10026969 TaxID=3252645 RepID=UPI003620FA03
MTTTDTAAHHQVGMDLAKHAGDRVSKVMLDVLSLCESRQQASMVAFQVLGVVAAQACGVITKHVEDIEKMDAPDMLNLMADMMREAKNDR